jgi:hypothetical protein
MTRVSILARLVVNGERGDLAVMKLIELVALMASMLGAEARVAIIAQLREEADALVPSSDRHALH